MPTIGGIEGKGHATRLPGRGGLHRIVGAVTVAIEDWPRAAALLRDDGVQYVGPVHGIDKPKVVTLNVRVTRLENPQSGGARVHLVGTGAPVSGGE